MRALVMAVTIVLAGECNAAFVAQEANGWRRCGLPQLDGCIDETDTGLSVVS